MIAIGSMENNTVAKIELIWGNCQLYDERFIHRTDGDVVITDPPFNIKYGYDGYEDNLPKKEWLEVLAFVCKPPCVMILYPEMMFEFARAIDEVPKRCVSWVYNSNTAKQHRMIAWFGIEPDFRRVGQPYKNPTDKRIKKLIAQGKEARLYDWWEINQVKNVSKEKTEHPCQMPLEVMRRVVGITPARRIIDPFAGSGTTLVAADMWGIDAVGIEQSGKYFEIMERRLLDSRNATISTRNNQRIGDRSED